MSEGKTKGLDPSIYDRDPALLTGLDLDVWAECRFRSMMSNMRRVLGESDRSYRDRVANVARYIVNTLPYEGKTTGPYPKDPDFDEVWPIPEKFFAYHHLPPHLQVVSHRFHEVARYIVNAIPDSAERTVALRKLLEAKDAAVRAM